MMRACALSFFTFAREGNKKMRRSPALRAATTFVSTLATLGAATIAVSTVATTAIRGVIAVRGRRSEVACDACAGRGRTPCTCCAGARAVAWAPPGAPARATTTWALCPLCGDDEGGRQKCWDCGGRGRAPPRPALDGAVGVGVRRG